jgi:hypothetical protein
MNKIYLENATDEDFKALIGTNTVAVLTDGNNSNLTDQALFYASKILGLKTLDLEWATGITDVGIKYLQFVSTLEYVDLSYCSKVSAMAVEQLRESNRSIVVELEDNSQFNR